MGTGCSRRGGQYRVGVEAVGGEGGGTWCVIPRCVKWF